MPSQPANYVPLQTAPYPTWPSNSKNSWFQGCHFTSRGTVKQWTRDLSRMFPIPLFLSWSYRRFEYLFACWLIHSKTCSDQYWLSLSKIIDYITGNLFILTRPVRSNSNCSQSRRLWENLNLLCKWKRSFRTFKYYHKHIDNMQLRTCLQITAISDEIRNLLNVAKICWKDTSIYS